MSMSDFDQSTLLESNVKRVPKKKMKGWLCNCWKMAFNTKVVPQEKLYNYLADHSLVLGDS